MKKKKAFDICHYCNKPLKVRKDFSYVKIDENGSSLSLANVKKKWFYICDNCELTVAKIEDNGDVDWYSKTKINQLKKLLNW